MPTEPHPICRKLRELRRAAGLSLADMENKYNVSAVLIGSYERGDRNPPLQKLADLLDMFGHRIIAIPHDARLPTDTITELRALLDRLERQQRPAEPGSEQVLYPLKG